MSCPQSSPSGDGFVDPTPLLTPSYHGVRRGRGRGSALRTAARMIREMNNQQVMGESLMRVRQAAADHIRRRYSNWVYSRPIVVLNLLWNTFLLLACVIVLTVSGNETTSLPLRLWIIGYGIQCHVRIVCVCLECRTRQELRGVNLVASVHTQDRYNTSFAKHLYIANSSFTFGWWIFGFFWVSYRGSTLAKDAPDLYRICIAVRSLCVFVVVIYVLLSFLMRIAVYFCLPCIIAVLYAITDQKMATKEDIKQLSRFMFRTSGESKKDNSMIMEGIIFECDVDNPEGHTLPAENTTCVICFSTYEDGSELRQLPCRHLFHSGCIDKWLYINATCPLCGHDILKNGEQIGSE